MNPIDAISKHLPEYIAWRRDLHALSELCFEEHHTSDFAAQRLEAMGTEVHRGLSGTGVVGVTRCKQAGSSPRSVALRVDMYALLLTEANSFGHASTTRIDYH